MRKIVIYNHHRPEKKELFTDVFAEQNIDDYEIFQAQIIQYNSIPENISESFKTVIRQAKERGDKEIVIFEDDILFTSPNGWKYFLDNKPDDYDLYIGGSYFIDNRINYTPPLVKVKEYVGNQCIMISQRYFDVWLNSDSGKHCDTAQNGKGEFYLCFPFVALQRHGWSANAQALVNYNPIIPKEYLYDNLRK